MSEFDFLLKEATSVAAGQVEGRIECEFGSPFSVPVMDSGFKHNELLIAETKKFVRDSLGVPDELSRIVVFTSLNVNLLRSESVSKAQTKLLLIRGTDGSLSALVYMGCLIDDPTAKVPTP